MEKGTSAIFKKKRFVKADYLPTCGACTCTFVLHSGGSNAGISVICLGSSGEASVLSAWGVLSQLQQVLDCTNRSCGWIPFKYWRNHFAVQLAA